VLAETRDMTAEDEDFLGLPGILSPEQVASLLARRDSAARLKADNAGEIAPSSSEGASWRAGAALRRELNRLVAALAARHGTPHAQIHAELRRIVPGPASAAASAEILERRRDHLLQRLAR
jgi:hypothetical protein